MKPSPLGLSFRRIGLACVLALSLSACAPYRLTSPEQIGMLPASHGNYRGSMWFWSRWEYRGSKARTHEFYYYSTDANLLHRSRVSIPREAVVLHVPEHPLGATPVWLDLHPDPKQFQFYYSPGQPPMR